jgi:hypothetical protein
VNGVEVDHSDYPAIVQVLAVDVGVEVDGVPSLEPDVLDAQRIVPVVGLGPGLEPVFHYHDACDDAEVEVLEVVAPDFGTAMVMMARLYVTVGYTQQAVWTIAKMAGHALVNGEYKMAVKWLHEVN